jgi:dynein heavy chain
MMWMPQLSTKSMELIFSSILGGFLAMSDNKEMVNFANKIVKSSIQIYKNICNDLLPTPAKSHYTFNLRDLSKVVQGIVQINHDSLPDQTTLFQLWIHELLRVFQDRLINSDDRVWFTDQIESGLKEFLELEWEAAYFTKPIFGDYTNSGKEYEKIDDRDALPGKFTD